MPFNNYAPQYIFKGQVQSDTAPSANTDLVRKQDVSGLSFISSIDSGSSSYLSVSPSGALTVDSLLISDVHVDGTQTSLANFVANEASTAAGLKKGDILVLTNATGGAETYIVSGANGSVVGNYTQIESGLTSAEIIAKLTGGTGIDLNANGTISFNGDTDVVAEGSSNLYYTAARFDSAFGSKSTSNLSEGSNLYYTDARSRAALSVGAGLTYNSSTGAFACSITQYTDNDAQAAFSYGKGIDIASGGVLQLAFDEFSTTDIVEGTKQFFTNARSRGSLSAGTGISYDNGTGVISSSITQYTDSNARASVSGGDGLNYNSATGVFEVDTGSGLIIDSGDQSLTVDNNYFRKVLTGQDFTANTGKTINHALGQKYVQVSVYDSSDQLIHAQVGLTDANNLSITMSDALTGATVVVSI